MGKARGLIHDWIGTDIWADPPVPLSTVSSGPNVSCQRWTQAVGGLISLFPPPASISVLSSSRGLVFVCRQKRGNGRTGEVEEERAQVKLSHVFLNTDEG